MTEDHRGQRQLLTVRSFIPVAEAGVADAHSHASIAPLEGAALGAPVLNEQKKILAELRDYRLAGGRTLVDCQPGGCGRDSRVLHALSEGSNVHILASTGFHLRRYYPPEHWLWSATVEAAADYFVAELDRALAEISGDVER